MKASEKVLRRDFMALAGSASAIFLMKAPLITTDPTSEDDIHIVGPKKGYSPQVGTILSMMNWMRQMVLYSVDGLSVSQLDHLHDENSNSIGAMLLHLAATEKFYQINTFEGRGEYNETEEEKWGAAMGLGDAGRENIKGNSLDYYLDVLSDVRSATKEQFKKKDDDWLMEVDDRFFGGQPTNNYCKWWHVAEHESNHNGQIKWLKSRLPG